MTLTPLPLPRPLTGTGTMLSVFEPSPSCPKKSRPQHSAASETMAQVWIQPAEMAVTPLASPDTATGFFRSKMVPSPSSP